MADNSSSSSANTNTSASVPDLTNILTSLQQGVTAINNLINTIKSIFPSS